MFYLNNEIIANGANNMQSLCFHWLTSVVSTHSDVVSGGFTIRSKEVCGEKQAHAVEALMISNYYTKAGTQNVDYWTKLAELDLYSFRER